MQQNHTAKFTDEELIQEYTARPVLAHLAHRFNVPEVTIWRRAKKLGLEFAIGGYTQKVPLAEILQGLHPTYQTFKLKKRLIQENILPYQCALCALSEWRGSELALQLDHIDGDGHNHRRSNLRLLCPNCHSQTDTWCGKNKK